MAKKSSRAESNQEEQEWMEILGKEFEWEVTDNGYFIVKLLEYVISNLNEHSIQRILRDVENEDLELALVGLKNDCRRKLLNSISKRLAQIICTDISFMEAQTTGAVAEASQRMMIIVVNLMATGEIPDNEYEIVALMNKLFGIGDKALNPDDELIVESELERLFKKYKGIKNRVIE